ncbi:MAG: YkgJ family cysteine cluster protein [Coriobacteriia bacterium]|nr:YkgJ family cysteine cluster protein [Coriobacteriia bacterium]MCL2750797.1 YkgJ family cysteine cluster protein [Coriobacteriia bacterium]
MTIPEPSKVREVAKLAEDSNNEFRLFLKGFADEGELDEQFLTLHNELFVPYDCSDCRNCCKKYKASITENEAELIAKFLQITPQEFLGQYTEVDTDGFLDEPGKLYLSGSPCSFLDADNSCRIEECKPSECREFPYTNKPERLFSLLSIVQFAAVCPVVYEILERLKQLYEFKPGSYAIDME